MKRVLEIAQKELGYIEQAGNNTKYGHWYGLNGSPWCMMFVQWCFDQAGTVLPCRTASCSQLLSWYMEYRPEQVSMQPHIGDIVIYTFGHCGLVYGISGNQFTAIEGNTSPTLMGSQDNGGGVYKRVRGLRVVQGFITPFKEPPMEEQVQAFVDEYLRDLDRLTMSKPASEWSEEARIWNAESQIFIGTSDTVMGWKAPLTREQAITAFYRFFEYLKFKGL